MNSTACRMLLLSNFREIISILESLRASRRPGRGMGQIATRPVFRDGIRASEVPLVAGGNPGDYPVLLIVDETTAGEQDGGQRRCVPLSAVRSIVFRSRENRERLVDKQFENTSLDGLDLAVVPELFGLGGEPRFTVLDERPRSPETDAWRRADALGGCLAAAVACLFGDPRCSAAFHDFAESSPDAPITLAMIWGAIGQPVGDARSGIGRAVAEVLYGMHGTPGHDPLQVLGQICEALRSGIMPRSKVERFRSFVGAVLDARRSRRARELDDAGDILLRALSLVILRDRTEDVIADRAEGEPPGPRVLVTAAALAGMREGLARLPAVLKHTRRDWLGPVLCTVEDGDVAALQQVQESLGSLLRQAKGEETIAEEPASAPGPEPEAEGVAARFRHLPGAASHTIQMGEDGTITAIHKATRGHGVVHFGSDRTRILVRVGTFGNNKVSREALRSSLSAAHAARLWLDDRGDMQLVIDLPADTGINDVWLALTQTMDTARAWQKLHVPTGKRGKAGSPGSRGSSNTRRQRKQRQILSRRSRSTGLSTSTVKDRRKIRKNDRDRRRIVALPMLMRAMRYLHRFMLPRLEPTFLEGCAVRSRSGRRRVGGGGTRGGGPLVSGASLGHPSQSSNPGP